MGTGQWSRPSPSWLPEDTLSPARMSAPWGRSSVCLPHTRIPAVRVLTAVSAMRTHRIWSQLTFLVVYPAHSFVSSVSVKLNGLFLQYPPATFLLVLSVRTGLWFLPIQAVFIFSSPAHRPLPPLRPFQSSQAHSSDIITNNHLSWHYMCCADIIGFRVLSDDFWG